MQKPPIGRPLTATRLSARHQRDFTPVSWINYFDEAHDISICDALNDSDDSDSFRVYLKNFQPPLSPPRPLGQTLDSSKLEASVAELNDYSRVPTLVMLHGGGYSALTWSEFSQHLQYYCKFRLMALDLRSHGDTQTLEPNRMDIDTLVKDVYAIIHETHKLCGFRETPPVVLVGHSMGGAITIKCATKCVEYLPSLIGIVVIDVVEGTAKEALPLMMSVIQTRPNSFPTLENAIEWSFKSGMAKNCNAARVSMPGNLVNITEKCLAIHDVQIEESMIDKSYLIDKLKKHKFHLGVDQLAFSNTFKSSLSISSPRVQALRNEDSGGSNPMLGRIMQHQFRHTIDETDESIQPSTDDDGPKSSDFKKPISVSESGYGWRTNLAMTQPHWNGWFDGLSNELLNAPVQGKFLLLAGVDRLDKALTIGQMQGKFMMKVLPKCGHAVHEDLPDQVANCIGDFLVRNKFTIH